MEWTTNPRWSSLSPDDARPLCAAISGHEPPHASIYFTNCGSTWRIGGRSYWGTHRSGQDQRWAQVRSLARGARGHRWDV